MSFWSGLVSLLSLPFLMLMNCLGVKSIPKVYFPTDKPSTLRIKARRQHAGSRLRAQSIPTSPINNHDYEKYGANGKTPISNGKQPKRNSRSKEQDSSRIEHLSLQSFIETRVPSLFEGYTPTWWLPNGHLQTGYVVAGDFTKVDPVVYERTLLRLPDGGTLGIDITPAPSAKSSPYLPDDTPIVVVQHGLTGGSYESYVRSVLSGVCAPREAGGLGFRGIVANFRGCANVPFTSPQAYSAMQTDDLRAALLFISAKYPKAPLIGLGFSLGANIMTRYVGEEGERSLLRAAAVLACPWDLKKNSDRLDTEFIPKHIYSKAMGANLMAMFDQNMETFCSFEPLESNRFVTIAPAVRALKKPTLKQMDHNVTRFVGGPAPQYPFESADSYYIAASSHTSIPSIRVPFLAINAEDDPIVGFFPTAEVESLSTSCVVAITKYGGHLGWFENRKSGVKSTLFGGPPPDRWIRRPIMEFIRAVAEDYIPEVGVECAASSELINTEDGMILLKGKEDRVGYRIVKEGIVVDASKDKTFADGIEGL